MFVMKSRLTTLVLVLVCAGCASNSQLGADDMQSFPLGQTGQFDVVRRAPGVRLAAAEPAPSQGRAIAAGVALDPMVAQDGGGDQLNLQERVVKLEGEMVEARKPSHSIALIFGFGQAEYDDDYDPSDEVTMYQLDTVLGPSGGLGMEFQAAYGDEKNNGLKTTHVLAGVGLRYTFGKAWFQPYVGGGYEVEYAKVDSGRRFNFDDNSYAYGPYVRGGINISLGAARRWFVGAEARYGLIGGDHDFGRDKSTGAKFEPDADYLRYSAFVGFRF